ncbi:YwqG family protein [Corynebacterium sp.]|uniref:YwqG family protein n=1 Tax=Corynebacterium sp. TaxID=1720 RepID=UPI0019B2BD47|nr:YwqG family protein [Corynebacterium sp.]HHU66584.1 DUF1963 domain-containing protein [Corynebacterium sp.]
MFVDHAALRASLAESDLSHSLRGELESLARPAARLLSEPGAPTQPGQSRFGGHPDLPTGFTWPLHAGTGQPLPFLAQINLADVDGLTDLDLPATGHLLFFYDSVDQPWGYRLADRAGFRLLHVPDGELTPQEGPDPLPPHRLTAAPGVSVPSASSQAFDWSEEDDAYLDWSDSTPDPTENHQLGGWPAVIQEDDMEVKSSVLSRGEEYRHGMTTEGDPGTWVLLAQFASSADGDWSWGDDGCLYVWMRHEDIRAGAWENAHLILQCF